MHSAAGVELKDICPGPCDKQKDGTVPCSNPGPCQTLPGTCSGGAVCTYPAQAAGTPCPGGFCDAQGTCVTPGGAQHCSLFCSEQPSMRLVGGKGVVWATRRLIIGIRVMLDGKVHRPPLFTCRQQHSGLSIVE